MTPYEFIDKWRGNVLKERSAAQEHFIDLCRCLDEPTPKQADPKGEWYAFEKGAAKTGGGDGWADVWKRNCFAWEYKGPRKNLGDALKQLRLYQGALENPPLLIVSDMDKIEVHTSWTNMVQETHVFELDDLIDRGRRDKLKSAFSVNDVTIFKPNRKRSELTEEVASSFVALAQRLRDRGHDAEQVAHFVNRMIFCMFAEDVRLLPDRIFTKLLRVSVTDPSRFHDLAGSLFAKMRAGGNFDLARIEWFNGGLFDDDMALPLERDDIKCALTAAEQDWSNIDPSIMGTLFERGLDPGKRNQLGTFYTDPDKIMKIINPVIVEPLNCEWESVRAKIKVEMRKTDKANSRGVRTQARNRARAQKTFFLERLKSFRILDPACGSGNFLYLGLKALKDIEHRVNTECEALGLPRDFPAVGPENVLGIEINPFAAELARVSVWIGEIQWMREHGFDASRNPILKPLDTISCRDALLNEDGTEAEWPTADVIVGNPPFLGNKKMIEVLSEPYTGYLRNTYSSKFSKSIDLVSYWIGKSFDQIQAGRAIKGGLVATQSVRRGADSAVLHDIVVNGRIFDAWDDEPWVVDGAAVRVSMICFDLGGDEPSRLDGEIVPNIAADLSSNTYLACAAKLLQNAHTVFQGTIKVGAFDIDQQLARAWLKSPNPHGHSNSRVLSPWQNGSDVTGRPSNKWIIDFGVDVTIEEAALYELPFKHVAENVKPHRDKVRRQGHRERWWIFGEARPAMRKAIADLDRYIVTPRVAKHRLFVWLSKGTMPDARLVVISRNDNTSFGLLHSRCHEIWTVRLGGWHGDGKDGGRPQYTPSFGFETFPFPDGLTPNIPADDYADDPRAQAIAAAAERLNDLRENWLNPPDLVKRVPEVVPGYPDRILPVDEAAAEIHKKRTLTNLYNERPAWLDHAHRDLDQAVAAAYGWDDWGTDGLADDVILERLFALNQERAAQQTQ